MVSERELVMLDHSINGNCIKDEAQKRRMHGVSGMPLLKQYLLLWWGKGSKAAYACIHVVIITAGNVGRGL